MAYEPLLLEKMRFATLILVTSFIVGSISGPLTPGNNQCSLTCIENKKFIYEIGKSYVYKYVADTTTKLQKDGAQESNIRIRAKVEFEPITNCEYILRLKEVLLEDPNSPASVAGAKDFQIALERYPLRFGNLDGEIKDVCPNKDEPNWVVNIKRGILSTFQNTMDNLGKEQSLQETDITGQCMTHYTIKEGTWLSNTVIKKSKDLIGCTGRTDHYTSFQSNPYQKFTSKTTPLVKSYHNCKQIFSQGQLKQSICEENHKFQPFSEGKGSGAISTNKQLLEFIQEEQGKYSGNEVVSKRTNLLFDHKYREFGQNSNEKEAEDALRELCQNATDDIRPETPRLFSRLVHKLQELNSEKLQIIYKNVDEICRGNRKARKFLYDAVPLTGTAASITLMRDLILNNEISKTEAETWLLMLSFLPRPNKDIIASSMPLLDNPSEWPKGLLAVSALTHSYCKTNPDCAKDSELKDIVKKLAIHLKGNCRSENDQQKEIILVTLKALGNIGHIEDALPVLNTCYQTATNPTEVRLAALDAFRRLPCNFRREAIFDSFFNFEEDVEVRIGSYLAMMKCPTENILTKIWKNLDNEEVNQVGSFVWTHLTSIQETSDPYKAEIKKILTNRKLQKKFSTDVRKFSRYFEGSLFLDSFKTGALADGTIIFSPKSYLPRSSTLGLTVDVFGESINLFEVGGRVEGFEFLVESFFGPKGYFPDDSIQKILESARDKKSYDESKLNQIAKIFNVKHLAEEEPRGEMFLRIFGNEINFMQFRGFEQLLQRSTDGFNILHELIQLTQKEDSEYTKSFMFLDSSFILPTSVGLPLNLTINGTAMVNLKVGGRLDLSQLRSKNLQFKMKVQPSATVEISGSMFVDAFVTKAGLKMVAKMHTSTYANGQIVLQNGEVLQANIDMPKNHMEVFDIQSKIYMLKGHEEKIYAPLVADQTSLKQCTGQGLSKALGLQLCGEIEFPSMRDEPNAPFLPMAGPMAAKIYLLKTDKTLNSYNLEYRWDKQLLNKETAKPYYVRTGRLSLDTPKSTLNRELTAEFVFNEESRTVDVRLVSPFKEVSFNGQFLNEKAYKKLGASLKVDDKERFALQSALQIDNTRNSFRLIPSLSIHIGGSPLIGLKGYALQQEDRKYSMEMTMEHATTQPIIISGFLSKNNKDDKLRYDADFTLDSSPLHTYIKWFMQSDLSTVASKGTIEYSWFKGDKKAITLATKSSKANNLISGASYNLEADFQCTDYPNHNWAISWNMLRANGQMENSLLAFYGTDKSDSNKLISLQSIFKKEGSLIEHKVASTVRILYPSANLDASVEMTHELTKTSLNTNLTLKSEPDKKIALVLGFSKGADTQELFRGSARLDLFDKRMELTGNALQPTVGDFVVNISGAWSKDAKATAVVTLKKHGPVRKSWGRELVAKFSLPGQEPIVLTGDVLLNGEERSVHGEANVNGQRYQTFAEYHRPSLENVQISAGAKSPIHDYSATGQFYNTANKQHASTVVKLANGRRVLTEIHLERDGTHTKAKASLALDADRIPENLYSAQLDFQKLFSGSSGSIVAKCPMYDADMGFSWNMNAKDSNTLAGHIEAWFAENRLTAEGQLMAILRPTSRDINTSLKINTSFGGFGTVGMTASHVDDGNQWKNNARVQVGDEEFLNFHSHGSFIGDGSRKSIDGEVKMDILFLEAPVIFSVNHSWTRSNADTALSIDWSAEQPIQIAFTFTDYSSHGKFHQMLNANLTTPYSWVRNVGYAANVVRKDKTMIQTEMHWEDKRILIDYEGSTRLTNDKIDSYSTIQVNTPIRNFETMTSAMRFSMDASSLTTAVDFTWDKERLALELTGTSQVGASGNTAMGSVHFVSPFYPLDDVLLTVEKNQKQLYTELDVAIKWAPSQAIVTQLQYRFPTSNDFYVKLNIEEPYNLFRQFGSEIRYAIVDGRFSGKFVGTVDKDTLGASADIGKTVNDDGSLSLSGLVTLTTPLAEMRNLRVEFENKRKPSSFDTQTSVEVNGQKLYFKHDIRFSDWTNFFHSLHLTVPEEIFLVREIRLKNMQTLAGNTYKHESDFSYVPDEKYSMAAEITASQNYLNGALKLVTPGQPYGPFSFLATYNSAGRTLESKVAVEYWPGEKIDIISRIEASPMTGVGSAKLTSPFPGFEFISVSGDYSFSGDEKTGNAMFQWTTNKMVKCAVKYQMKDRQLNSEIAVFTPFIGYENARMSVIYNGQDATKTVKAAVFFGEKTVLISAEGKLDNGIGRLAVDVSSPFKGFENFAIETVFDITSSDKKATFKSSTSAIEISAFHNIQLNSMDSRITFTSAIQGLENISLVSHFDNNEGEKKSAITIAKGTEFNAQWLVKYLAKPQNGHLDIAFTSTIGGLESMRFGSKYQLLSQEKEFMLDLAYNEKSVDFKTNLRSSSNSEGQATVVLTTPCPHFGKMSFVGLYDWTGIVKVGQVTLTKNEKVANLRCELEMNRAKSNFKVILNTPVEGIEDVQFKGSLRREKELVDANLHFMKGSKVFEANVMTSISTMKGVSKIVLKTPIDGFKSMLTSVEFESIRNKREVKVIFEKEQQRASVHGVLSRETNVTEISFDLTTPIPKFESIRLSGKFDLSRPKCFHTLTYSKGEEIYSGTMELLRMPSYFEVNLLAKTPVKDASFYANYNFINPNALGFDVKILNEKSMAEIKGRYRKQHFKDNVEGLVSFNTNYLHLTSVSVGFMYDNSQPLIKEVKLHCNVNGLNNDLVAYLNLNEGDSKASVKGTSAYLGWKKFDFSAKKILSESKAEIFQVNIDVNDTPIQANATVTNLEKLKSKVMFSFTTPHETYALIMTRDSGDPRKTFATLSVRKGSQQIFDALFRTYIDLHKFDGNLKIHTVFNKLKAFTVAVSRENGNMDAKLDYDMDGQNLAVNLMGKSGDQPQIDVLVTSNFDLPFVKTRTVHVQMASDLTKTSTQASLMADEQEIFNINLTRSSSGNAILRFSSPVTKEVIVRSQGSFTGRFFFEIEKEKEIITKFNLEIIPTMLNVEFSTALFSDQPLNFNVRCLDAGKKSIFAKFTSGTKNIEFEASLVATTVQRRNHLETKFGLKSSFQYWENIQFEMLFDNTAIHLLHMTSSLLWAADQRMHLSLDVAPSSIKCTFTSPFVDYEVINFVAELFFENRECRCHLGGQWSSMKAGMMLTYTPGQASLKVSSPFRGFESFNALLRYNTEPLETTLIVQINEDKQIELNAHANLDTKKSDWKLSLLTPLSGHESYVLVGEFDFTKSHSIKVLAKGRGKEFKARLQRSGVAGRSGELKLEINTPVEMLRTFSLDAKYGTNESNSEATVKVSANDQFVEAESTVVRHANGLHFQAETNIPVPGYERFLISGQTKMTGGQRSGDLFFKVNGDPIFTFSADVECKLPSSLTAHLKMNAPVGIPIKALGIQTSYVRNSEERKITGKLDWNNDEEAIQIEGRISKGEIMASITTPFSPIRKVGVSARVTNSKHFILVSTVEVEEYKGKVHLEVKNQLPSHYEVKFDLATPFSQFESMASSFVFNAQTDGRLVNSKFFLEMPWEGFRKTEASLLFKNNDFKATELQVHLNLLQLDYSVEGVMQNDDFGSSETLLTIRTPHRNFEKVTFRTDFLYVDNAERGAEVTLTLPKSKHSVRGSYVLKMGNIGYQLGAESTLLMPYSPIALQGKYDQNGGSARMAFAFIGGNLKRILTWSQNVETATYKGKVEYEKASGDAYTSIHSIQYILDLPATPDADMGLSVVSTSQYNDIKNDVASVTISLKEQCRIFDAAFVFNQAGYEHRMDATYSIMDNAVMKTSLKIKSPILPSQEASVSASLNPKEATIKVLIGKVENSISLTYQIKPSEFEGTLKANMPTLNIKSFAVISKLSAQGAHLKAELTVRTSTTIHSVTSHLSRSPKEKLIRLNVRTPLWDINHFMVNGHIIIKSEREVGALLSATFRRKVHKLTFDFVNDDFSVDASLKAESPLLKGGEFAVQLQLSRTGSNRGSGLIKLTSGDELHEGRFNYVGNSEESSAELLLETPLWNLDSFLIKSHLLRNKADQLDANLVVMTPRTTHSLGYQFNQNSTQKSAHLIAYTPFLRSGQFSVTAKVIRDAHTRSLELAAHTVETNHTISLELRKTPLQGTNILTTLKTPFLGIKMVSLRANVFEIGARKVDASLELNFREVSHLMNVKAGYENGKVDFGTIFQTPLFGIGYISTNGQISIVDRRRINLDMTMSAQSSMSYTIHGFLQRHPEHSFDGQFEITAPGIGPILISAKMSRLDFGQFSTDLMAKTSLGEHRLSVHFNRKNTTLEFLFKLDSSLIPCQSILLSGDVTVRMPVRMMGSITLETPGKAFRFASNYRKRDTGNLEGGFTVVTPFQVLPMLRVNGSLGRNRGPNGGFDGNLEMHTVEDGFPEAALSVKFDRSSGSPPYILLKLQVPFLGYPDVSFNYASQLLKDSSHFNTLKFKVNNYIYGYDCTVLRKPELRDVQFKGYTGRDTITMKTTIERNVEGYSINIFVETPIKSFESIEYNMRYNNPRFGQHAFETMLSMTKSRFGFNGELTFVDKRNFDSKARIQTSVKGYENVGFKIQQRSEDGYLKGSFEQAFGDRVALQFVVENYQNSSDGSGNLKLLTPFNFLRNADAYYEYDTSHQNAISANLGLNHNGRNLFRVNALSKSGTKIVEIVNPIQPVTVEYTFVKNGNVVTVQGKYCWDASHGAEATIGFSAKITATKLGRKIVVRTIHPSRPLKLTFALETSDHGIVHQGEISWNEGLEVDSVRYAVETRKKLGHGGKISYDVDTRLSLPVREFQLNSHWEKDAATTKYETVFKWDALRDSDKMMAVSLEHRALQPGQWATVNFRYPKTNQNLTLHGEFMSSRKKTDVFNALLEFIYGRTPSEKITLGSTLTDHGGYNLDVIAKHPASNLDVKMVSSLMNDKEEMRAALKVDYQDQFGHFRNMELRSKIVKLNNHIHMMLKSHAQKLDINAQIRNLQKGYLMHMESKLNDNAPITLELELQNTEGPMANFNVVYDPNTKKSIHIRAGMQDMKTILMEAYRNNESVTTEEMRLLMTLNRSREFITRFNWHPGMLKAIEDGFTPIMHSTCTNIRKFMDNLFTDASKEYRHKLNVVKECVLTAVKPIVTSISNEVSELERDTVKMRQSLQGLYRNNEFFIRDMYNSISSINVFGHISTFIMTTIRSLENSFEYAIDSVAIVLQELRQICENMCSSMTAVVNGRIRDIPYIVLHYANELNRLGSKTVNEVALKGLKFLKDVFFYWVPPMSKWQIVTPEWVQRISNNVASKLQDYVDRFFQSSYYQQLVDNFEQLRQALQSFYDNKHFQLVLLYAQPICEYFESSVATFLEHPYMQLIVKAADYGSELASWAFDFFKIQDRAKDLLGLLIARGEDVVLYLVQEMVLPEYQLPNLKSDITFDPENGKLQILQPLPIMWSSFTELPNIYDSVEYSDLINLKDHLIRLPKASLNKLLHAMRSEFSWKHMVPTFRGRALLVGNQHYVTFDGRAYEFAGECSYLLAHDFMDNNFTAIVKYSHTEKDEVEKKSFLVIFNGHHIELYPNLTVTVNGLRTELPLSLDHTHIVRTHNALSLTNEVKQVWARYESTRDVFMLEIGGFYHGKTSGLFGSYDHEPFDDFQTPARKTASDLEEFASSWEIGTKTCLSNKNHAYRMDTNSYAIQKPCNDIFGEYETLTPCLRKINSGPYKRMCVNDVSVGKSPCVAVAAYAMMCQANGIAVTVPDKCSECNISGTVVPQGKKVILEGASVPRSLDVVFVIDNTWQCSTTFPTLRTTLTTLGRNVEGALSSIPLSDIHYAVVGFGVGAPYIPRVITADGNIFGGVTTLDLALNNTHFAAGHHHHVEQLIEFATDLPFRSGVGKIMIVVPCAEPTEMYIEYQKLTDKLNDNDIKLHVTSLHELVLNGINKIKTSDIMGFDRDQAYMLASAERGKLVGDKDIRRQMNVPKNTLTQLALATDGSVFYASRIASNQPSISTLATEAFSRRIAQNAAPAPCQNCLCSTGVDGTPHTVCSKCY